MKKIIGIVLILGGGWLVYTGHSRAESIAGKAESGVVQLQNEIDGKSRVAEHVWFYAGGGVLIVAGAWLVLRKG